MPVIPPVGCDGEGHSYRLNSDAVAVEVARAASRQADLPDDVSGHPRAATEVEDGLQAELLRQLSVEEAESILKKARSRTCQPPLVEAGTGGAAVRGGVPRVHIIDGRVEEGLLAEVFSNEGIGTLIHANEYQAIRRAHRKDARAIYA